MVFYVYITFFWYYYLLFKDFFNILSKTISMKLETNL